VAEQDKTGDLLVGMVPPISMAAFERSTGGVVPLDALDLDPQQLAASGSRFTHCAQQFRLLGAVALLTSSVVSVGCTAAVSGSASGHPGSSAGSNGLASGGSSSSNGTGGAGGAQVTDPTATGAISLPAGDAPSAHLHKLTATEFANSVHDLLGQDAPLAPVEQDSRVDGFASVGASTITVSPMGVGLYETATGAATAYAFGDATKAAALLPCIPQSATDTACMTQALQAFGRRAFRRPLTDAETTRYVKLGTDIASGDGGTVLIGLRYAVWAILQTPDFLYRVELGAPSAADGGRLKYTSYEVGSRLAGALWNGSPDDALLDAAAADSLSTPDGIRTQAQRMLADPKAHRAVLAFTDDMYGLQNLDQATKDPAYFPNFTDALKADMRTELEQRIDDMFLTTKGDFLSLYDSKSTFVNKELATYYGLPAPSGDGFQKVQVPDDSPRVGLLGAGAILAAYALPQRNSTTKRGKFLANTVLCITIPPPPGNAGVFPASPDPNETLRQIMIAHRSSPSCSSCHGIMDPLGFGMENFDSAGMYRTMDKAQPIDASGTLSDGTAFNGLAQLGSALRKEAIAGPCFVSKVYENALGRQAIAADDGAVNDLAGQFATSQNHADQLLLDLVASDSFRFVTPKSQ
jgi:hypothetical protein